MASLHKVKSDDKESTPRSNNKQQNEHSFNENDAEECVKPRPPDMLLTLISSDTSTTAAPLASLTPTNNNAIITESTVGEAEAPNIIKSSFVSRRHRLRSASIVSIDSNNLDMQYCSYCYNNYNNNTATTNLHQIMEPLHTYYTSSSSITTTATTPNDDEFEPIIQNILQYDESINNIYVNPNLLTNSWALPLGQYQTTLYRRTKLTTTTTTSTLFSPISISSIKTPLPPMPRSTSSPDLRPWSTGANSSIRSSKSTKSKSSHRRKVITSNSSTNSAKTTGGIQQHNNFNGVIIRETRIIEEGIATHDDDDDDDDNITNTALNNNTNFSVFRSPPPKSERKEEEEEEVDMSLGMKLTIIGGNVIVQDLVPLKDGRVSPAQLSGKISIGDVLIAIDNKSLQGLDIESLVAALQPLKGTKQLQQQKQQEQDTMDDNMSIISNWTRQTQQTATTQRSTNINNTTTSMDVKLRFVIGGGLELLFREKDEQLQQQGQQQDLFSTFAGFGADSFTGMPFLPFDVGPTATTSTAYIVKEKIEVQQTSPSIETRTLQSTTPNISSAKASLIINSTAIDNNNILPTTTTTRSRFFTPQQQKLNTISYYIFNTNESNLVQWYSNYFDLLQDMPPLLRYIDDDTATKKKKIVEDTTRMTREETLCRGTVVIKNAIATFNRVEELDRRRSPTTTIDLTSSSSSNNLIMEEKTEETYNSNNWKSIILSLLKKAEEEEVTKTEQNPTTIMNGATVTTPANDFTIEGLLFGEQVAQILNRKKSCALPDASLSSILSTIAQQLVDSNNSAVLLNKHHKIEFLLFTGLARWMKTFKPLKWQYRRILWPVVKNLPETMIHGKSDDLSSIASNSVSGSVTTSASVFSTLQQQRTSAPAGSTAAAAGATMTLENIIEELELNSETRTHACFLVTFYFTHATMSQEEAIQFVRTFGAYLNLSESLAVASRLYYDKVIDCLLDMAVKYDVIHKKAKLEFDVIKTGLAMCQEPPLSVLFQYLKERALENSAVLPFLISAYPELQPWLVRKAAYAVAGASSESARNYYEYLSTLLDPMYGFELARADRDLVRDWCLLSVISDAPDCRANFYSVARGSNKTFARDIPVLLDLSMKIRDFGLSLSLAAELLADPLFGVDSTKFGTVLSYIHQITESALSFDVIDSDLMANVFECLNVLLGHQDADGLCNYVDLSSELGSIMALCKEDAVKLDAVAEIIVNTFPPAKALEAIQLCNPKETKCLLLSLRTILTRSAMDEFHAGLSGALLRVRRAREALNKNASILPDTARSLSDAKSDNASRLGAFNIAEEKVESYFGSVWRKVLEGAAVIEK